MTDAPETVAWKTREVPHGWGLPEDHYTTYRGVEVTLMPVSRERWRIVIQLDGWECRHSVWLPFDEATASALAFVRRLTPTWRPPGKVKKAKP